MRAAIVMEAGKPPAYGAFDEPVASGSKNVVRVTAAAISHVTRGRASGSHYSTKVGQGFVPGVDGTGVTADGRRVYFIFPEAPFGAMAEQTLVDAAQLIELPEGLSDIDAAAMAIPGMSSWAALTERAHLVAGETVLINGATGASGRLAIQIAKHLGAKKVIATARNAEAFADLQRIGADVTIALTADGDALETSLKAEFAAGVDIVLDYLWGMSAETIMVAAARAAPEGVPVRFVGIGAASGGTIALPSAALRSSSLVLMGSGIGSVPFPKLVEAIRGVLAAAPVAGFEVATEVRALSEVTSAWGEGEGWKRVVLVP